MQTKNRDPLDVGMIAFQVRPDWYEEYWLNPNEPPPPAEARWRRQRIAAYSIFVVAIVVVLLGTFRAEPRLRTLAKSAHATFVSLNVRSSASVIDDRGNNSGQFRK